MVVDTSILLAVFFNEPPGSWAARQLQEHRHELRMSTVTYAEALILIQDRQPQLFDTLREAVLTSTIRLVPPSPEHAELAASARLRYPLNLGDCFAYALAKSEMCQLLTLDRDFRKTDVPVVLPHLR
jgi:ribonuclease VapC